MALEIVQYGENVLHEKGVAITQFDGELEKLFHEMVAAMDEAEGIGLAAQQIGKAIQFCVVDCRGMEDDFQYTLDGSRPPTSFFMPLGMCNPVVEALPSEETTYEEGCLSFPNVRGDVERPDRIRCHYQDLKGNPHVIECTGIFGRCIQHEVDHLNGILFIDRMKKRVLKKIQVQVNGLRARTLQRLKRDQ